MKNLILVTFLFASLMANSQNENFHPKYFAETLFEIIKTNDATKMNSLIITDDEIKTFSEVRLNVGYLKASEQAEFISTYIKEKKKLVSTSTESLDKVRKLAEQKRIIWDEVIFKRDEYNLGGSGNVAEGNFTIYFTSAGEEYYFKVYKCIYVDNNWKLGSRSVFGDVYSHYITCEYCSTKSDKRSNKKCTACGVSLTD